MQPGTESSLNPARPMRWRNGTALVLLVLGCMAALLGVWRHDLLMLLPAQHLQVQLALAGLSAAFAALIAGSCRFSLAAGLGLVWFVLLLVFVDTKALLAAGLLALAAWSVGRRLFDRSDEVLPLAISIVLGLALLAGTLGWMLAFPLHHRGVYIVALLALAAWSLYPLRGKPAGTWIRHATLAVRRPRPPSSVVAAMSLGLLSTALWLPNLMFDDLAHHLAMASQLERWQYYRMDAASQVWALAPWASSVLHSMVWVIGGEGARSAINLLWLALTISLLWRIADQLGLAASLRWWLLALVASLPMSYVLLAGLQTETATIVAALALVSLMLQHPAAPDPRRLLACAVLLGFLLGLKASNVLLIAPIGIWMLVRWYRSMPWRWVLPCAVLSLFVGLSSYSHSWWLTGNPFLPLYNDIFQSPFFATDRFFDARWTAGFELVLPWRISFDTDRYFEGWPGAAGLVWVALIGLVPLALLDKPSRPVLVIGLIAIVAPLMMIQYLRYVQPGLVLALIALMLTLRALPRQVLATMLGMIVVVNLAFHGNAHWTLRVGALPTLLLEGRSELENRFFPEVAMARWIQDDERVEARILLFNAERPFHARFAGQAFSRVWYDPALMAAVMQAEERATAQGWLELWTEHGMTHVLTVDEPPPDLAAALDSAKLIREQGSARLWELDTVSERDLMLERDLARRLWPAVLSRL